MHDAIFYHLQKSIEYLAAKELSRCWFHLWFAKNLIYLTALNIERGTYA